MPELEPRVVITGSSSGIGRATALLLDREGFRVFAGVRRAADAEELRRQASRRLIPLRLDVADPDSVASAAGELEGALGGGGLAGLVNNAGIGVAGPLEYADVGEMRRCFEVNVFGVAALTQALLPLLRRGRGRIVNVSSGAGRAATPLYGAYSASKFALEALSDALRVELRGTGVAVSVVEPGVIDTPMQQKGRDDAERLLASLSDEARARYAGAVARLRQNIERLARNATPPERVARAILDALTAPRPRTRYAVGADARTLALLARWLPDRARDAIFARFGGL
jgi:NAD(P)-dependent dehydrogenase (short-subunit alcohol dehydrogenase family)